LIPGLFRMQPVARVPAPYSLPAREPGAPAAASEMGVRGDQGACRLARFLHRAMLA
jgi:hypothetical protein